MGEPSSGNGRRHEVEEVVDAVSTDSSPFRDPGDSGVSPRFALMIGGIAAMLFGLAGLVFPTSGLAAFGLAAPDESRVLARDAGATLIGLGVINWMARNATGETLRALLVGNVVVQALELLIDSYEIAVREVPPQAVGGLLVHLVLGAVFVLAMRSASARV
jgi:hypothetical protein